MFLLLPFLVDTVVVYENPDALSIVHEWGVVVFEQSEPLICGGPWINPVSYPDDIVVEAPVVLIYGEPFTGSFSVTAVEDESITFVHPKPTVQTENQVRWDISVCQYEDSEQIPLIERIVPYHGPFDWAVEYWRAVPSLPLVIEDTGERENFLYYECTVNTDFTYNFFEWSDGGNPVFTSDAITEALYSTPAGVFPFEINSEEFIPMDIPMGGEIDPGFAVETLCRWAGSRLKSSEITALWETWRPVLTEEGSYWLVFPIPQNYHEEISRIELQAYGIGNIEYERFFLGAIKLSRIQE